MIQEHPRTSEDRVEEIKNNLHAIFSDFVYSVDNNVVSCYCKLK